MFSFRHKRQSKLVALLVGMAIIAAACGSGGSDTVNLSDGSLPTGEEALAQLEAERLARGEGVADGSVDFSFENFEGEQITFSEFSDKPVVLNFFASWCATCIAELPDFETVSNQLDGEVEFLGLATNDRLDASIELLEATGVTFDVGQDPTGEIFNIFQGLGMPTTVFINADGTVADVHTGVLNVESLIEAVNENLRP